MNNTCDKKTLFGRCNRPAFQEVYWKTARRKGIKAVSLRHYSYLCRYHYYLDRIKNWLFRWENWYCDLDDDDKKKTKIEALKKIIKQLENDTIGGMHTETYKNKIDELNKLRDE